jgi:hypothetical protein
MASASTEAFGANNQSRHSDHQQQATRKQRRPVVACCVRHFESDVGSQGPDRIKHAPWDLNYVAADE